MKGFMYTLEVLVAIGLVIVASVVIFKTAPEKVQTEIATLKLQGTYALKYLDDQGTLRSYVNSNNESLIEADLRGLLSSTVNFEAEICASSCSSLNVPDSKDVISIDHYVSGYRKEYLEKRVKLWIWKK